MKSLFQTTGKVTVTELRTPSEKYQPFLSIDGDQWCALYGTNMQDGVAGFGKSPQEAMDDFDKNFNLKLAPRPNMAFIDILKRPPKISAKIAIYPASEITDETIAEIAAAAHLTKNFPRENRKLIEIKSRETERVIGCQNFQCPWNSDYTCFHDFPIFARGMMGFVCISKDD